MRTGNFVNAPTASCGFSSHPTSARAVSERNLNNFGGNIPSNPPRQSTRTPPAGDFEPLQTVIRRGADWAPNSTWGPNGAYPPY